jgi:4-hydroxybenzoate polyprenyltransferase
MTEPAPARHSLAADLLAFVRDIRLEHSLFALPFALLGVLLVCQAQVDIGARALPFPSRRELLYIVLAMVGARTAAMGFNRVVDRRLDARNPRTARRALAAGRARLAAYWLGIGLGVALLLHAAARLNPLALRLAPAALAVLLGYSYTKRFTAWCHAFLGLALGLSPLAAWVAIGGALPSWRSASVHLLDLAVVLWVAGFDILYATLDVEFDRANRLHSAPAALGIPRALTVARWCHAGMLAALAAFALLTPGLGLVFGAGVLLTTVLLVCEHAIVTPDDLQRVNTAFFTINACLGLLLLACATVDWLLW